MATISNHLRGASELMLVANIKDGFVQHPERLVSYATRLGQLLDVMLQGRRVATEVKLLPGSGPIERLDTIFSTQWAIRQRPQKAELIVSAVFDSSWEAYCRSLQVNTGELLDAIFCHCEGYDGHTCVDAGYEKFSGWLRDHQVQTRFFHTATPDLTVSDLRGLRRFAAGDLDSRGAIPSVEQAEALVRNAWPPASPASRKDRGVEREQVLNSMIALAGSFPESERVSERRNARQTYDAAIRSLLVSSLDTDLQKRARELGLLPDAAPPAKKPAPIPPPAPADLQHNILRTHNDAATWEDKIKHGCLVMIQCDDTQAALCLLRALQPRISTDQDNAGLELNLAFTQPGMTRLGVSDASLASMPPEFRQGMASRAGLLGDVGPHAHPSTWERLPLNWPRPSGQTALLSNVDVVLLIQRVVAQADVTDGDHVFDAQHPLYTDLQGLALEGPGVHILHVQALRRYASDHFRLGEEAQPASQPIPPWPPGAAAKKSLHDIPLGEVLLGHRDRHGSVAEWVTESNDRWLFENGTFLVVRKLQQDVAAFRSYIERCVRDLGVSAPLINGWILGRYPADGRTLVAPGAPDPLNEFDYSSPEAAYCPLHAHVRRVNPRLADTPRILRRSFPYGSEYSEEDADAGERGLMFMAYNASIAEQFEVLQRWLNGGNATALPSVANDLIAGVPQVAGAQRWAPGSGVHKLPPPERPFVALRWGLYLFVPSLPAIERLIGSMAQSPDGHSAKAAAKRAKPSTRPAKSVAKKARRLPGAYAAAPAAPPGYEERHVDVDALDARGVRIISEIFDIEDPVRQREAWKEVLEEQPERLADAGSVWEAIRHSHLLPRLGASFPKYAPALKGAPVGTLPTAYGLLVSRYAHARQILSDDGTQFSVAAYRARLDATIQGHYLGRDGKDAKYGERAPAANAYLSKLSPMDVYDTARKSTREVLTDARFSGDALATIDVRALALLCIGSVTQAHLITPELGGRPLTEFIHRFIPISRYCFQPHPDKALWAQAEAAGKALQSPQVVHGPFADYLRKEVRGVYEDDALVRSAVIGAIVGFAPPAVAHVINILRRWLNSGELQRYGRKSLDSRRHAVIRAMTEVPVPPILYRTIMDGARLDDRALAPIVKSCGCEFVVVGTQSVTLDQRQQSLSHGGAGTGDDWQWLFAGDRTNTSQPGSSSSPLPAVHGCPARNPAVAAISGIIDAVSEHPDARLCGPLHIIPGAAAQR